MWKILAGVLLVVPMALRAAPPDDGPPPANAERVEKRMRLARILGIAEALDLNESQANQAREVLNRFDEQRKPLMRTLHDNMGILRRAAQGDAGARGQVDEATARVFEARRELQKIDVEAFQALAKGLSPEKKARLLVFLSHFRDRFRMGMATAGQAGQGAGPRMGGGRGWGMGPRRDAEGCPDCPMGE
jgi:Spy/CpxP family protein refolding chaperone